MWDSHVNSMREKAELMTRDYQLTIETAGSVINRSIEMAAIIKEGTSALERVLREDPAYKYYYDKMLCQEE